MAVKHTAAEEEEKEVVAVKERSVGSILRRSGKEQVVERVALGIRVCEVVMCVVSFAVMSTNKTPGWSGDSFSRYKEYRSNAYIEFLYQSTCSTFLQYELV